MVAVDDGSTDATRDILAAAGSGPWRRPPAVPTSRRGSRATSSRACGPARRPTSSPWAITTTCGTRTGIAHQAGHPRGVGAVAHGGLGRTRRRRAGAPGRHHAPDRLPGAGGLGRPDAAERMRTALRTSVATGGASMIRPARFPRLDVPEGWLHDRWWSLVATGRDGLLVDREPVIDYRVQPGQQVGLDAGAQGRSGTGSPGRPSRAGSAARWRKARDLRRRAAAPHRRPRGGRRRQPAQRALALGCRRERAPGGDGPRRVPAATGVGVRRPARHRGDRPADARRATTTITVVVLDRGRGVFVGPDSRRDAGAHPHGCWLRQPRARRCAARSGGRRVPRAGANRRSGRHLRRGPSWCSSGRCGSTMRSCSRRATRTRTARDACTCCTT